jgi:hypothetical protein
MPGPTCSPGQACVDAIPSGWSGFVQIVFPAGDAGAGCTGSYPTEQAQLRGQTNPDGGPATCAACACALPEGGITCSVKAYYDDALCTSGTSGPSVTVTQTCTTIGGTFGGNSGVSSPTVAGGACVPSGGQVTSPPPALTSMTAAACGQPDAGAAVSDGGAGSMQCTTGQACAAIPSGGDGGMPSGVCIYQSGVQTCPPSGTSVFTNTFVVGAVEDDRSCGSCSCGDPSCPTDGVLNGYSSGGCTGTPAVTANPGSACKVGGTKYKNATYTMSMSGSRGTCAVADGGPTGSVTIDGGSATTFCCVP